MSEKIIFYGIGDMEEMTGWSSRTIKRRVRDGVLPRPITWKLYGENTRKPLQWLKTDVDRTIAQWSSESTL